MRFARALASLALLTVPASVAAQPPAMSGVVHHAVSGKPIECLHVALADSLGRTVSHTVTDAQGTFVVVAPDTGTFRVRFIVGGLAPMQGPLLHLTPGLMTEQEYPVSFDHLIAGELESSPRRIEPTVDLGEWRSAIPHRPSLGRGARPATSGEGAYATTRATSQSRVAAELIIDADGSPRGSSWRTIASSNPALITGARSYFLRQRFEPARIGEQPVCELQILEQRTFRVPSELGR
jgi:hypothetical protein